MAISEGDLSVFVTRPLSAVLLLAAVALLLGSKFVTRRLATESQLPNR
jgi:TctA family transporter